MVLAAVLAGIVTLVAIVIGVLGARGVISYSGFVGDHYRLAREERPSGQCARLRCTKSTSAESAYCSATHELDARYNEAGY